MSKELKPVDVTNTPAMLIDKAIEKGMDISAMERLFDLQERWEKNQAKKAFDSAMANFQMECPMIEKTKHVPTKTGEIAYSYAPIESIVEQVKKILQKNGLSYTIKTEVNGKVKSTCIVKHIDGHSEESSMEVPLGNKTQVMSDTQVVAAASTFAKRYAFCNALGIMTGDEDTDARPQATPDTEIDENKYAELEKCTSEECVKKFVKTLSEKEKKNVALVNAINKKIEDISIPVIQQ